MFSTDHENGTTNASNRRTDTSLLQESRGDGIATAATSKIGTVVRILATCHNPQCCRDTTLLISLCDILGRIGANQMYKNGIYVSCIKEMVNPHHSVFTPIQQEYLDLLEQAPLPPPPTTTSLLSTKDKSLVAMDIGVGTGVLTAGVLP